MPLGEYFTPAASRLSPATVGAPAGGDQQVRAGDALLRPALVDHDGNLAGPALHAQHFRALENLDAVAAHAPLHKIGELGIILGQERRQRLDHRHARAEPAMRLRQLAPDRPAADDEQVLADARRGRRRSRW